MNVVPYIDRDAGCCLVIFMVTAPMLTQGVTIELPNVEAEALPQDQEQKILTLSVKNDGSFYWNLGDDLDIRGETGNAADVDAMVDQVGAIVTSEERVQVYIRADEDAVYSMVVAGMAALQKAGVTQLGLITEAPQ